MTETKPDTPPETLLTALLKVQKELPRISLQKTGKNPAFKSSYLTLDGLHAAILPCLNRHGLVWATFPEHRDEGPVLRYELIHAPSAGTGMGTGLQTRMDGTMPLMLDKQNSQGLGSAITYARRYSLLSVIGAVGDEDDDGNKASTGEVTREVRKKSETDRPLTDEERLIVVEAIADAPNKDMLLRSVGCDSLDSLTVFQGREIMRKVGKPAEVSAK